MYVSPRKAYIRQIACDWARREFELHRGGPVEFAVDIARKLIVEPIRDPQGGACEVAFDATWEYKQMAESAKREEEKRP